MRTRVPASLSRGRPGVVVVAFVLLLVQGALAQVPVDAPRRVIVPDGAAYLREDGSAYIVGDDVMAPFLVALNTLFVRAHPEIRITLLTRAPPTGIDGIVAGVAAVSAVAHDAWEAEVEPLRRQTGRRPGDIRIGRRGYRGEGRENPPGVYVNAANPLARLTMDEVARIFTSGQKSGDLRTWGQVGVDAFGAHAIHVYGPRNDGGYFTSVVDTDFGGRRQTARYEALTPDGDVVDAVANDRYGIGIADFLPAGSVPTSVRFLPLASTAAAPASSATRVDVARGAYPLSPNLHFYFRADANGRPDPFVAAYARLALSPAGQALLAELGGGVEAYVPLTATEVALEIGKLNR